VNHLSDLRSYFDEIEEKILDYINWHESAEGGLANLHTIEESQKEIVF